MNKDELKNIVLKYISEIESILSTGDAGEHAYRPAFKELMEEIVPDMQAINEPSYTGGNAPDFLFKKNDVPVAYAECKDVTVDIKNKEVQKQAKRYVDAFGKILLTNYFEFQIIDESGEVQEVVIARKEDNKFISEESNIEFFINILSDYFTPTHRTIKSAKRLAVIMASKARLLRDSALASLSDNKNSDIYDQYKAFKEVLINDLSEHDFADMYAQTLVYGLFVARYFDPSIENFSRHEAQDCLPSSNPLLKKFFGHVAGTDYDPKISWLVDSLVDAYLATDVHALMHKEFTSKQKDSVLHFYETFLTEYDQGLRKSRGVYYTPEPVVSFIVRSVNQILKSKFNLAKGLADNSKIEHKIKVQSDDGRTKDGNKIVKKEIHKVQILDPAVGTGTFLNEVINEIHKSFKGQEGLWSQYVQSDLLKRLHGFELMMASYTMAHLKLGVTLSELGYKGNDRLSVWLTNSLDKGVHEIPNLFMSQWLTEESNQASKIKSEMPIMVVLGNPPYSVSSSNKGEDIQELIKVYKENLNERKINLDDDYIKFIRFAENQIEKTGYGVVAMITNNSFLDGITHRQMRKHLMETFDEIYVLDLHGNSKKKEIAPDGGKDENVFNIMQGVSINIFVKKDNKKSLAKVYHAELFGKQKEKFIALENFKFSEMKWDNLKTLEPYYFFVPKDFRAKDDYERGFSISDILVENNTGIQTKNDKLAITFSKEELEGNIEKFKKLDIESLKKEFPERKESSGWNYKNAKEDLLNNVVSFEKILYRPFDIRNTIFTGKSSGFIGRPREKTMKHMLNGSNLGLITLRINGENDQFVCLITNHIIEKGSLPRGNYSIFPLFFYNQDKTKNPNLDKDIWDEINEVAGKTEPEDILDYIYAVLYSPSYREKYKEFLKIDFPRVPYPSNKKIFWDLVKIGKELRELHLLESETVNKFITTFPEGGTGIVENKFPKFKDNKVYINETQYFGGVPEEVWNFYIGGYQPAQKWLKDRKERELSVEDIEHYQMMIKSMSETIKIMGEINIITFTE